MFAQLGRTAAFNSICGWRCARQPLELKAWGSSFAKGRLNQIENSAASLLMKSTCDLALGACVKGTNDMTPALVQVVHNASRAASTAVRRLVRVGLAAVLLSISLPAAVALAEGDVAAGGEKAYTCLGCHGVKHYVNTYPTYHVPFIAGQHKEYLVAALQAYRSKTRSHPTMQANASLLSDQDIEDIAAWFAAQDGN